MKINTKTITRVAIFGAIAALLYSFISFPLGTLFLPFYKFNFSDVVVLISGFAFGPLTACLIQVVKVLVSIIFLGSNTQYVGEFSDLILGIVFVLPAAIYYKRHRNIKGALIGSLIASLIHIAFGFLFNLFVLLPVYGMLGLPLVKMIQGFYEGMNVTEGNAYVICALLSTTPFNILRDILIVALTFLLYKRLGMFIKYIEKTTKIDNSVVHKDPVYLTKLVSIVIFIISLAGLLLKFFEKKEIVFGFILLGVAVLSLGIFITTILIEKKKALKE